MVCCKQRMTGQRLPRSLVDNRPRVLFIDQSFTFGGAIRSLAHLVGGLSEQGVEAVVASGQPPEVLERAFSEAETISLDIERQWRRNTSLYQLIRKNTVKGVFKRSLTALAVLDWHLRRTVPSALRYARIGSRHDVDIVHLNNTIAGQFDGFIAAKLLGVPCIAHARGFQEPTRVLRAITRMVDHHIAISEAIRRNLVEIGASPDRISVVHDGMNLEEYDGQLPAATIREDLGVPHDAPLFGFFGRVIEWKGVREFVLAAERVLQRMESAHALVVGDESDGGREYFEDVRGLTQEMEVGERILFTGYREDVPELMRTIDVVVHTSIRPEPFGMVLAEAMAAGKPVVAADEGGPLDIVEPGSTGYLVNPEDTASVARLIRHLLENPDEAKALGRAGRRRAEKLFGKERYAAQVFEIYEGMVE